MNILNTIRMGMHPDEMKKILDESTIFDKIEFSGITKQAIRDKIYDLETRQVPERKVLLDLDDEVVANGWFKNWLHPRLKHAIPKSPVSKVGCSRKVLEIDMKQDHLHLYENGQQNFRYSLQDIKNWLNQ